MNVTAGSPGMPNFNFTKYYFPKRGGSGVIYQPFSVHHHHLVAATSIAGNRTQEGHLTLTVGGHLLELFFLFFRVFFFAFLPFLGLIPQHMEVPRLGT